MREAMAVTIWLVTDGLALDSLAHESYGHYDVSQGIASKGSNCRIIVLSFSKPLDATS